MLDRRASIDNLTRTSGTEEIGDHRSAGETVCGHSGVTHVNGNARPLGQADEEHLTPAIEPESHPDAGQHTAPAGSPPPPSMVSLLAWVTRGRRPPGGAPVRLSTRAMAALAGLVSTALIITVAILGPLHPETEQPEPTITPATTPRGNPQLADQLADQAREQAATDPTRALTTLIAAAVVDPDNARHRIDLAAAVLASAAGSANPQAAATQPQRLIRTHIDLGEPITFATISADASFMIVSGVSRAQIWQTRWITPTPLLHLARELDQPVHAATGTGTLLTTTLLTAGPDGVQQWLAGNATAATTAGTLGPAADAVALSSDGRTAVLLADRSATIWTLDLIESPTPMASLPYDQPPTALTFAPTSATLVAGYADGSLTLDAINLAGTQASTRTLTSSPNPIDDVAISANATTTLATHTDGTITVWDLTTHRSDPTGTANTAAGRHRAWISADAQLAIIATGNGPTNLWSLIDPQHPRKLAELPTADATSTPAMVSADGRTELTIDTSNILTIWNLDPILNLINNPLPTACQLSHPDQQQWHTIVADPAYPNPCQPAPLPTISRS